MADRVATWARRAAVLAAITAAILATVAVAHQPTPPPAPQPTIDPACELDDIAERANPCQ